MDCSKFKLKRVSGQPVSNEELLEDLLRVSKIVDTSIVSQQAYKECGRYDVTTISRRFGRWNTALIEAGLELSNEVSISDERLFENILNLWQRCGRQPRRRDLLLVESKFSQSPYNRRFGSWTNALKSFVEFMNDSGNDDDDRDLVTHPQISEKRSRGRDPSLRLRYKVLKRDGFSCRYCGASPAKTSGVDLHVDHVIPWSKGGDTTAENLQTLCNRCNLGKGDLK